MLSRSIMSKSLQPHKLWPSRLLCPGEFSRQEYWIGWPCPPPGDLPSPGIEPRSPSLWVDSLPSEPPGKPSNTGVGSLSFLQGIAPTQESNWGLPHCRQILYQLSCQGQLCMCVYIHIYMCICVCVCVCECVWYICILWANIIIIILQLRKLNK